MGALIDRRDSILRFDVLKAKGNGVWGGTELHPQIIFDFLRLKMAYSSDVILPIIRVTAEF